jgi:hypothetical protein
MQIEVTDMRMFWTNDTIMINGPPNLFNAVDPTINNGNKQTLVISGYFPPFDETTDPQWRTMVGILYLAEPLQYTFENNTRVMVILAYPREPFVGGDPITFYGGTKTKFWLPIGQMMTMIGTKDLTVMAVTFQGPEEDQQWFEKFVVTLPNGARLVEVNVKRGLPPPGKNRTKGKAAFESLEVFLGDASQPLQLIRPQVFSRPASSLGGALRIGVGRRPQSHPRFESTSSEIVYIESDNLAFGILAVIASQEFPSDYRAAHENKHLDMFIMEMKGEHSFIGVLPELWGVRPRSELVDAMTLAPSEVANLSISNCSSSLIGLGYTCGVQEAKA